MNGHSKETPAVEFQVYKITGYTELPIEPPDGIINDLVNTISFSRGDFVPVVRISPLANTEENVALEKHILHDWHNCTLLVKKKYGVDFNSNKENWITLEDLVHVSHRVVILNMFYRNALIALAKKQPYWNYSFFESFWHRDTQKGNIEAIGQEFLKNNQAKGAQTERELFIQRALERQSGDQ